MHFLTAWGARPGPLDDLGGALDRTRLVAGEVRTVRAQDGEWSVALLPATDAELAERFTTDGHRFAVVHATAPCSTAAVLDAYAAEGPAGVRRAVPGSFQFVGFDPAQGFCAMGDRYGMRPVYWRADACGTLVSTRSTALVDPAGPRWDLRALGWLLGHSNIFGTAMPAAGATSLLPGTWLWAASGSLPRAEVGEEAATFPWPGPDDEVRSALTAAEWDDITDELVAHVRALDPAVPLELRLSGGKDSRVCAALVKAAGLADAVDCFTAGARSGPEVLCAAEVARIAGLPHRVPDVTLEVLDSAAGWRRLRRYAHRYEAILGARDGDAQPRRRSVTSITGFGGELFRGPGGHAKRFAAGVPADVDDVAKMFVNYHQKRDPLAVLVPGERKHQARWMREWVVSTAHDTRLDVLPERFFVENRLGNWNGPMAQCVAVGTTSVPLLASDAALAYLSLAPDVRAEEHLHFEVIRRCAPELLDVPFLGDTWKPAIRAASTTPLPGEPFPVDQPIGARALRGGRWRFLDEQGDAIADLFALAERSSAMSELCDLDRLTELVRDPDALSNIQVKTMESAILIALCLLGETEPVLDEPN